MSEDENGPDDLAEQLLDLMIYAPIGLALEARELLPKLAERGRGQIALTRLAGKVASDRGQSEARKVFDQVVEFVGTVLAGEASDDGPQTDDDMVDLTGDDSSLPISDYDTLSAPQLLPHLEPLDQSDLADVLAYEKTHRSRATVINRIKQLQD